IKQQAKSRGKLIRLQKRLGLIYLEGDFRAEGQVYVVIVVPRPPEPPGNEAAVAGTAPSNGPQKTSATAAKSPTQSLQSETSIAAGNILQLNEDETIEAIGGGIALIVLQYNI
ncbi:hypothetical protein QBC46DRAFT_246163, partial [Diplogelasinospora grovesii]